MYTLSILRLYATNLVFMQYAQINGTFQVCDSDDMLPPGVFTTAPGATTTWFQPTVGPVGTPPYVPITPSSSNCQTFASTQLFVAAATATATGGSASGAATSGASGTRSGSGSSPSATGSSGAVAVGAPITVLVAALFGVALTLLS